MTSTAPAASVASHSSDASLTSAQGATSQSQSSTAHTTISSNPSAHVVNSAPLTSALPQAQAQVQTQPVVASVIECPALTPLHLIAPGVSYLSMPSLLSLLPPDTNRGPAASSSAGVLDHNSAYHDTVNMNGSTSHAQDQQIDVSFLDMLNLKMLMLLSPERPSARLCRWAHASRVKMVHFGLGPCPVSARPVAKGAAAAPTSARDQLTRAGEDQHEDREAHDTERLIKEALELILDRHNLPILVVDTSGANEGALLLGCFRRLQGRNFANICAEYRSIAGSRAKTTSERFIEMFDTDLIALPPPDRLPDWWNEQLEDDEVDGSV
ncbi:Predicted protein tyrosine phosphatase [Ceraceosorus bombacis]|uniref:Uncharacterized protein n=1 Tax=Ceraceosorus bombacis TaxID=401625 RepID=A0A0P1BFX2_9BASI|nr:Predicted protein tyrosine phosphatase [Ceraceosorus bombacis]